MIAVGTCGYSYRDWIGPLYPKGTKSSAMLERYAEHFATVELDVTYYRVLAAATFAAMARRTPAAFVFSAKLPSTGTHAPAPGTGPVHPDVQLFRENVQPLVEAGKFACVLMQFPNAFRPGAATHAYLEQLRAALPDLALVAEFRHREWQVPATLTLLRRLDIGLVNVDEPHFKTLPRESSDATSEIAYVRLHGRNAANWWRGTNASRYDYLYDPAELVPWVDRIVDLAATPRVRKVLAYFNNHPRGNAVRNAEMLETMLSDRVGADVHRGSSSAPDTLQGTLDL